jgi:hypothetical protein
MFGDSSYIFSLSFLRKDLVKDAIVAARSLSPPYGYIEGRDFRETVKALVKFL